ncbi:MAG TPA: hypothetical protein DF613_05495 [Lachnospiraceae bacterium]|nr:hypothetical protein [Lachnospiraceae bacterium]
MNSDAILHLTLKQLEIFLKCYQARNYTYVAERYHYTPSTISKTIHAMEEILGYPLFSRTYHELVPTAAADVLAREWDGLFALIMRGLEQAEAF